MPVTSCFFLFLFLLSVPLLADDEASLDAVFKKVVSEETPSEVQKVLPVAPASPAPKPVVIVIDPGHGGKDAGAVGFGKYREKDLVLQISKKVALEIKKIMPARVYFTRQDDRYISLADRNLFARRKSADLFLSIHANASENKRARGVEVYYLNNATSEAARRLARRENEMGLPGAEEPLTQGVIARMIQNASTEESAILANLIRENLVGQLKRNYSGIHDLGVKTALFYVLVDAKCPGVLIETSFVSHLPEAKRLANRSYQLSIAQGIARGVKSYFEGAGKRGYNL